MTTEAQQFADRYTALWNERDPAARRAEIAALWLPDGNHFVRTLSAQGYDALFTRVTGSHEKNVRDGGYIFKAAPNAQQLQDTVTFNWHMVRPESGDIVATGLEFVKVDSQRRIVTDYQFIIS